jgi:hypothetical protein
MKRTGMTGLGILDLRRPSKPDEGQTTRGTSAKSAALLSKEGYGRTGAAQARSQVRAPKFGSRNLVQTPHYRLNHHVQRVDAALQKVQRALAPFTRANAVPSKGETLSPHRQRTWRQRTGNFARAMDAFEKARRSLLSNRSSEEHDTWTQKYGNDNPEVREWKQLSEPQIKALEIFLRRFSTSDGLQLADGVLQKGATPASAQVIMALGGAVRTLHASVDPQGAANIDHLATVYKGVLEQESKHCGRPLKQSEADKLAFNTVCTDIWMKGQSLDVLNNTKTAPTSVGSSGKEIYDHMKSRVRERFNDLEPALKAIVHTWIDRGFVPMDPQSVDKEAASAKLNPQQAESLKSIWGSRIMASGDFFNVQSFMLGVWLHGIPAFDSVKTTVQSAGSGKTDPKDVYFAVLGHHMAGFIAAGFARGSVKVNFAEMEKRGELPTGASKKLEALYESAVGLAAKWRPIIDEKRNLSSEQRADFRNDASSLRKAISALPEEVRSQLLNDDEMQFTPVGIEKWINMTKGDSNGAIVANLYEGPVQAYYEEQLARDLSSTPGAQFEARSANVAHKIGVHLDPDTQCYRLAQPGEPEYLAHGQAILEDPVLRASYLAQRSSKETQSPSSIHAVQDLDPGDAVEWFRNSKADSTALIRLAQS